MTPTHYEMFSALAEPHRLEIVELLRNKPRPVGEIVSLLHLQQPQVSKHLKILSKAGIVQMEPVANLHIYKLHPKPFKELDIWLSKYRSMWEERFSRLDALLAEEKKNNK